MKRHEKEVCNDSNHCDALDRSSTIGLDLLNVNRHGCLARLLTIGLPVFVGLIFVSMAVGSSYDEMNRSERGLLW